MLAEGEWPYAGDLAPDDGSGPRAGDGLIRLDADGTVAYASPNALSAYRRLGHRGDLLAENLAEVTRLLAPAGATPVDEPVTTIASGRVSRLGEVEGHDAVIQLRSIPLRPAGEHIGAVLLVRDVTELRRRERQLIGKDATIREIHHRVKNNLQTVAALLRLQARRVAVPEARLALEESVRRVSSIAVVHETLSGALDQSVRFDEIADRIAAMIADVVAPAGVQLRRSGTFGVLSAEVATPLAMAVTELLQNAVEHGFAEAGRQGLVELVVRREGRDLHLEVADNGAGLPAGFDPTESDRLGLQIVRTLVETELGGALWLGPREGGGTAATIDVTLPAAIG
jgi:two-component sensor histidine kinase